MDAWQISFDCGKTVIREADSPEDAIALARETHKLKCKNADTEPAGTCNLSKLGVIE